MKTKKRAKPKGKRASEHEAQISMPTQPTTAIDPPGIRLALALVFVVVLAAHFAWSSYVSPAGCAAPAAAAELEESHEAGAEGALSESGEVDQCTPLEEYFETGDPWIGLSFALALTFAFYAWSRFRRDRSRKAENATLGGLGITGLIYAAGCFVIGCCGSPMLGVWLGLVGPHFVPLAKPLVFLITVISVSWGWWNLNLKAKAEACECN